MTAENLTRQLRPRGILLHFYFYALPRFKLLHTVLTLPIARFLTMISKTIGWKAKASLCPCSVPPPQASLIAGKHALSRDAWEEKEADRNKAEQVGY